AGVDGGSVSPLPTMNQTPAPSARTPAAAAMYAIGETPRFGAGVDSRVHSPLVASRGIGGCRRFAATAIVDPAATPPPIVIFKDGGRPDLAIRSMLQCERRGANGNSAVTNSPTV